MLIVFIFSNGGEGNIILNFWGRSQNYPQKYRFSTRPYILGVSQKNKGSAQLIKILKFMEDSLIFSH